jgi:cytochrome P450
MPVYDPLDLLTHADPYPAYARLRDEAPLYHQERRGFWALSRHGDVAAALKEPETYASSAARLSPEDRFYGLREQQYVAGDSERHAALRAVLTPILSPRALTAFEPAVEHVVGALVDDLPESGAVDLADQLARHVPVRVTCRLLGLPDEDAPMVDRTVAALCARRPGESTLPDVVPRCHRELRDFLERALRGSHSAEAACLVDAAERGLVSWPEAVDLAGILVAAGIKTTSTLIGTMLLLLAADPGQQHAVRQDPTLAAAVVEEALRFDAPAQWVTRRTTRDAATPAGTIPQGERVLLLIGSAHRDAAVYDDPDVFDPGRKRVAHLAFGGGMHFCAGAALARMEARIALQQLVEKRPPFTLAGEPERVYTPAERELGRIPCRFGMDEETA